MRAHYTYLLLKIAGGNGIQPMKIEVKIIRKPVENKLNRKVF